VIAPKAVAVYRNFQKGDAAFSRIDPLSGIMFVLRHPAPRPNPDLPSSILGQYANIRWVSRNK